MNPVQGYLNSAELIKTWLSSGGWATACAVVVVILCHAVGRPELILSLATLGAAIGGAFGKVSGEIHKLPQGVPIKPSIPDSRASDTADFVPGKPA